jgi:hypothetical protein
MKKEAQVPVGKVEEEKRAMPPGLPAEPVRTEKPVEMKPREDEEIEELRKMLEEPEKERRIPPEERVFEREPLVKTPEKELAELVEAPKVFKRLGPIDRQMFYFLEKQRRDAISRGDLDTLKKIHEEEERIIEKYTKEVVKDELSGFTFAYRQAQGHFFSQRKLGEFVNRAFDAIADQLTKMGITIYSASLLSSESDEWDENPKEGKTEWNLLIGTILDDWAKSNIVVMANVEKDKVKIYPYFFDYLGRKYSFDEITIRKYLQSLRPKPSSDWVKALGWEQDKDLIEIDNKVIWASTEMNEVQDAFQTHLKEVEVEDTGSYAMLSEIKFDERNGKVKVVYTLPKNFKGMLKIPKKIKFASYSLKRDKILELGDGKIEIEYIKEE